MNAKEIQELLDGFVNSSFKNMKEDEAELYVAKIAGVNELIKDKNPAIISAFLDFINLKRTEVMSETILKNRTELGKRLDEIGHDLLDQHRELIIKQDEKNREELIRVIKEIFKDKK